MRSLKKSLILGVSMFFFLMISMAFAEVMYEVDPNKIPKFPASKLPDAYEPPDWKQYPWYSPPGHSENFTVKQPNAAEKLMWRAKDGYDSGYSACSGGAFLMDENRFGHVRRIMGMRWILYYYDRGDFKDLLSYNEGKVKPGECEFKDVIYLNEPPQIKGLANLTWKALETPSVKREQDRWTYVPALRRTRRLAAGADDDKIAGTDYTVDDVGQREVWEEEYTLIGEDQLGPNEHQFYNIKPPKQVAWAYKEDLYKPPVFDCWVILAINRKPKYYFPKRIIWIDKKTQLFVREEQYDFHGNLWKIYEYGWKNFKKIYAPDEIDTKYFARCLQSIWDLKINHRTFNLIFGWTFDDKSPVGYKGVGVKPEAFFDVKRLEREEPITSLMSAPPLKRLEDAVGRPPLLRGKQNRFAPYRKIELPEEIEKKLIEEYGE